MQSSLSHAAPPTVPAPSPAFVCVTYVCWVGQGPKLPAVFTRISDAEGEAADVVRGFWDVPVVPTNTTGGAEASAAAGSS